MRLYFACSCIFKVEGERSKKKTWRMKKRITAKKGNEILGNLGMELGVCIATNAET